MGCAADGASITTRETPLKVGEATVIVVEHEADAPGLTYLNLHDDENTAVEAALDVIERVGGRVVELRHSGERNVVFPLQDSTYVFDPNRIFTGAGAERTLRGQGTFSQAAVQAVRAFADTLLSRFGVSGLDVIVTLHNNTEDHYSVLSYVGGGEYEQDAQFAHVTDDQDPDDFFFVTDLDLYDALREAGFNVVLQDNARVTDDGSLSVRAGQRRIPYVNVEAQHGHFEEQVKMLDYLTRILAERSTGTGNGGNAVSPDTAAPVANR